MRNRTLTTAFIFLILSFNSKAQDEPDGRGQLLRQQTGGASNLNAPSVDLSTGIVSPSYPLMSISGTDVSTNVSLVYTGGQGIKVNEKASEVGLGWRINAGGYIKRTV